MPTMLVAAVAVAVVAASAAVARPPTPSPVPSPPVPRIASAWSAKGDVSVRIGRQRPYEFPATVLHDERANATRIQVTSTRAIVVALFDAAACRKFIVNCPRYRGTRTFMLTVQATPDGRMLCEYPTPYSERDVPPLFELSLHWSKSSFVRSTRVDNNSTYAQVWRNSYFLIRSYAAYVTETVVASPQGWLPRSIFMDYRPGRQISHRIPPMEFGFNFTSIAGGDVDATALLRGIQNCRPVTAAPTPQPTSAPWPTQGPVPTPPPTTPPFWSSPSPPTRWSSPSPPTRWASPSPPTLWPTPNPNAR